MDHLPLPCHPVLNNFRIPFLCTEPYDDGSFSAYPARRGWNVRPGDWPVLLSQHEKRVTEVVEIGAFLQTWLYFGLLSDMLGAPVSPDSFATTESEEDIPRFHSHYLEALVRPWCMKMISMDSIKFLQLIDQDQYEPRVEDDDAFDVWIRERQDALNLAEDIWQRVAEAFGDEGNTTIKLILLSIAALGDYLGQAIVDIARVRGIDLADRQVIWLLPESVCRPVLEKMQGWCPNRVNGLITSQDRTVGVLWYYANIQPPRVHDNHSSCTAQRCGSLHVKRHRYQVNHVREDCQCTFTAPSTKGLADIVRRGSVATFELGTETNNTSIVVRDSEIADPYVAISHVWADGHGNLDTNSLPLCFLERLQMDVDAIGLSQNGRTPIWMDTICLPRYPVELRTQAITSLSKVFSGAVGILVIDSYLQSISSFEMEPIEVLVHVSLSGWTSRLWTFSEGQLAQRIWVKFKDRVVDLLDLIESLRREHDERHDTVRSRGSDYDISSLRFAAILLIGRKNQGHEHSEPLDLFEMKSALISRHTSWRSDEALCLGAVLQVDLEKIAKAEDEKKMLAFWQQIEFVPSALVFTHCTSRLEDDGYRWAPSTMLGGTDTGIATIGLQHSATYSTPTKLGLKVTAHALMWSTYSSNPFDSFRHNMIGICQRKGSEFMLKSAHGGWYSCTVREQWHQLPIDSEMLIPKPVILFLDYWQDLEPRDLENMHDFEQEAEEGLYEPMRGVFATHRGKTGSQMARAHTLIDIRELTTKRRRIFDELAALATLFSIHRLEAEAQSFDDPDGLSDQIQAWLTQYLSSIALQRIMKDIAPVAHQHLDEDARLGMCIQRIRYFCLVGDWYKVKSSEDWMTWIVD